MSRAQRRPSPTEAAAAMPTRFLECRDDKHWLDDYTAEPDGSVIKQVKKCVRCGVLRTRYIKRNGYYDPNRKGGYVHPPGYLVKDGADLRSQEGRAAVRFELLQRKGLIYGNKVTHISNGQKRA